MRTNTKRTFRYFFNHIKQFKISLTVAVILMLLVVVLELLPPYFYKVFFDTISSSQESALIAPELVKIIVVIAIIHLTANLFRRLGDFVNIFLHSRVMSNIYHNCFEYLHKHSYDFFASNFTGSLVKKVNRIVYAFESIADKFYYELIPLGLRIIFIFIVLFWIHPVIGLIMLAWTALFLLSNYLFTSYKWKFDVARAKAETNITGVLADTITNSVNLKLFASLPFELKKFKGVIKDWMKKLVTTWKLSVIVEGVQAFAMILLEFFVLYFAIKFWKQGLLTIGDFVWIQAYLLDLFMRLWGFGRMIREVYVRLSDAEEMIDIFHTKHGVSDVPDAKNISIVRGKIEFNKVRFSYVKNEPVIKNLDLKIKSGEKVGLIGPSGGGKSTITKLLLRFCDIQKGKIVIDSQDIKNVTQDSLRSQISFVPQDPILFHRTLMDNIRYGRSGAGDEEVMIASKLANCHEFIMNFPDKYNTYVGERGIKLSGGERQRVAIARAILANAPILILDEATSSLDSESEMLIQEAFENLMKQKTTIVIAHRLSTIMRMDRIIVLQDGKIVEEGAHSDLLSQKTGLYKKLWDLQMGGYVNE